MLALLLNSAYTAHSFETNLQLVFTLVLIFYLKFVGYSLHTET